MLIVLKGTGIIGCYGNKRLCTRMAYEWLVERKMVRQTYDWKTHTANEFILYMEDNLFLHCHALLN